MSAGQPPSRVAMADVITRLEVATEGSADLDAAIVYALHPDIGPYEPHCPGEEPIFYHDPYHKKPAPKFTTSLDAGLTLVPEGWWASIDHHPHWPSVRVHQRVNSYHRTFGSASASHSTAIALCIAALRAHCIATLRAQVPA